MPKHVRNERLLFGTIKNANPLKLKKIFVGEPCTKCDILSLCGGRCLYANVTKRWNASAYKLVCETVRNLIEAVSIEMPKIQKLTREKKIQHEDFEFMKYNGCEIIP